jgi:hypothetical protein
MDFEWEEAKNRANVRKHGFDFAETEEMFGGFLLILPDTREDYWRGAMAWDRHDRQSLRLCGIRGAITRYHPNHFAEEGEL